MEGPFHPRHCGYESNRIGDSKFDEQVLLGLRERFYSAALNLNVVLKEPTTLLTGEGSLRRLVTKTVVPVAGRLSHIRKPGRIRFLEKTPKNSLRVPLLERLFPDALYIWLKRAAAPNIDSLVAGWHAVDTFGPIRRERYGTYRLGERLQLAGHASRTWKFALVPGWRDVEHRTVPDMAAWQYLQCNRLAASDLASISPERVLELRLEDFVLDAPTWAERILVWAGLSPDRLVMSFASSLPRVNAATPTTGQGLRYAEAVAGAMSRLPDLNDLQLRMGYVP
jgi:hypothetical protein